jgi:alpha-tubulin suppressor-like RCC1 family protein
MLSTGRDLGEVREAREQLRRVAAGGAATWTTAATGDLHTCAIDTSGPGSSGRLFCWGHADGGQIGDGQTRANVRTPTLIDGATDWQSLALGNHSSCGLKTSGARYCWGSNSAGVYGDGAGWIEDFVTISPEL